MLQTPFEPVRNIEINKDMSSRNWLGKSGICACVCTAKAESNIMRNTPFIREVKKIISK